jgi:hypothetical protein
MAEHTKRPEFAAPGEPLDIRIISPVVSNPDQELQVGLAEEPAGPKVTTLDELSPREREHLLRVVAAERKEPTNGRDR